MAKKDEYVIKQNTSQEKQLQDVVNNKVKGGRNTNPITDTPYKFSDGTYVNKINHYLANEWETNDYTSFYKVNSSGISYVDKGYYPQFNAFVYDEQGNERKFGPANSSSYQEYNLFLSGENLVLRTFGIGSHEVFNLAPSAFKDGVIPSRLIVVIQAAGGGGGTTSASTSGYGGGSGACLALILNLELLRHFKSTNGHFRFKIGNGGWGGVGAQDPGKPGVDSSIFFYYSDDLSQKYGWEVATIGAGKGGSWKSAGAGGEVAGKVNYEYKYTDTYNHSTTLYRLAWALPCTYDGEWFDSTELNGCKGGNQKNVGTSSKSCHIRATFDPAYYYFNVNRKNIGNYSGGSTTIIAGVGGGGGGASYFAAGGNASTSAGGEAYDGSLGSGGGGGIWTVGLYPDGGHGGDGFMLFYY